MGATIDYAILGLHGESMGSGISISSLKYKPDVDFVIADCGYGVLSDVLEHKIKQIFHLPKGFLKYLDFFAKNIFGYSFYDVRPIDCLKENDVPVCFIHGKNDNFIDYAQSQNMSKATPGYSEVHLFDGADHAQSIEKDKNRYYTIVENFLNKVLEKIYQN
ncbi:MAG: alpha/beta hydrolase [Ruminococcus sp.]|nr:alpha/beta hydrolase [Ruminococcus sp.]